MDKEMPNEHFVVCGITWIPFGEGQYTGKIADAFINIWYVDGNIWHYSCDYLGIAFGVVAADPPEDAARRAFNKCWNHATKLCDAFRIAATAEPLPSGKLEPPNPAPNISTPQK